MRIYFICTVPERAGHYAARLVRAESEMHARQVASLHDRDDGMRRWLDAAMSNVVEVPFGGAPGVVITISETQIVPGRREPTDVGPGYDLSRPHAGTA